MIDHIFHFGADSIFVRIDGTNLTFGNTSQGGLLAPLKYLKLSKEGVVKEFPDLKDDKKWQEKAIERFKEKIKSMKTEKERSNYIIADLRKHGYTPRFRQVVGHRMEVLK